MTRAADPRVFTNELLTGAVTPLPGQRVLALGVAAPLVVAWAEAVGDEGTVAAIEHWLPDWRALELEAQRSHPTALVMHFTSDLDAVKDQQFDSVVIDCSSFGSSRALTLLARAAALLLVPGGSIFAAGPKEAGIMAFSTRLEEIFGGVEVLAYRKGQRVVVAYQHGAVPAQEDEEIQIFHIDLGEVKWELQEMPGVFAKGNLDDATAMLISELDVNPGDRVLDLGCGSGIIGMVAAHLAPKQTVVMTDADAYALDLAARNCEHNGITNVRIVAADVVDTIASERFTVVTCNPPFHLRNEHSSTLADRFIRGAESVMHPGGRLYFVANRFLPYESRLEKIVGSVKEVAGDERYKVLMATKRSAKERVPTRQQHTEEASLDTLHKP